MTKFKPTPASDALNEIFAYDLDTGILSYLKDHCKGAAGGEAGWFCRTHGYRMVGVNYENYRSHRIIWKMVKGVDAPDGMDHIDGNRLNNRIKNLREATASQNAANAKLDKRNTSGVKGVSWLSREGKWHAAINHKRKKIRLGDHKRLEDAAEAVRVGRERFHGEFARFA